jgi:hypothetical protein
VVQQPEAVAADLSQDEWTHLARIHHEQVDAWIGDRLNRRARGEKHPVDDFLFDYYPYSPARLRRWHPGPHRHLEGRAAEALQTPGFMYANDRTFFDLASLPENLRKRLEREVTDTLRLLKATRSRPGRFGCFGMHEWAMVLGLDADHVRHTSWPLRVSPDEIRQTIEAVGLRCTHFDAFRFFTPEAIPLNPLTLTRQNQAQTEQPGCLHATMDLYKYAMRLQPLVPMDLVADAFALARDIRNVDMQAAPYDLSALGVEPIPLEHDQGRKDFADLQRQHAQRGAVIRDRLIESVTPWTAALTGARST